MLKDVVSPEVGAPLYLRVRDQLAEQIKRGEVTANIRLPSERVLAERFDITRVTARLALAQLEAEGRIYRSNRRCSGSMIPDTNVGDSEVGAGE